MYHPPSKQSLDILHYYLVEQCQNYKKCQKQDCLDSHINQQRRRPPFGFNGNIAYNDILCPNLKASGQCKQGDDCSYSHCQDEFNYHPNQYKTGWCDETQCPRGSLCYKAHYGVEQLRSARIGEHRVQNHIDLNAFKVNQCKIPQQHNPKHCQFYHSFRDKRRKQGYGFDMCQNQETCQKNDLCLFSHNRVEQLYHPEKYKTKFCTFYPNQLQNCDYGEFCSFAHNNQDIKIDLIDKIPRNTQFYVYHFKTVWCPYNASHDKAACPFAHNWQDYRRKPENYYYQNIACPYWKSGTFILTYEEGGCPNMMSCDKCHGWKELEYHPYNYKEPTRKLKSFTPAVNLSGSEESSPYMSQTPHIGKTAPQTYENSGNASQINFLNKNTDEFFLFRGQKKKEPAISFSPFAMPFFNLKSLNNEVQAFLRRHGISRLADQLQGIKLNEIPNVQLTNSEDDRALKAAFMDEQEDEELDNDLIMNDIAIFTGQKPVNEVNLIKYSLSNEFIDDELTVAFPSGRKDLPDHWKCPITKKLMHLPVKCPFTGVTYEQSALLLKYLESYGKEQTSKIALNLIRDEKIVLEIRDAYS